MITESDVEKAADYIRDCASDLGAAKANRIYLEQFRKSKKALLVQQANGTIQERDSFAYGHPEYLSLLDGLRQAVQEEERLKWMMIAAQAKIEIWRTEQANNRNQDRSHR